MQQPTDEPIEEMAEYTTEAEIETDIANVAEAISMTVNRLGWRMKLLNAKIRQASVYEENIERTSHDMWHFKFDAVIRWKRSPGGVIVTVKVIERLNQWTQEHCQKRCDDIIQGIENDCFELQETDGDEQSESRGSARWASAKDLEKAGYSEKATDSRKLILGPGTNQRLTVPIEDTEMHAIVCGPTGSGKSSTIFIPNLIERTGVSAIVTEATAGNDLPDLFAKTSGYRQKAGHQIYYFNPDDLRSHRINPLSHIKTYAQALEVASLIIKNTSSPFTKDAKVWEDSETQLLTTLILHAVSVGEHLGTIRAWLRLGARQLSEILLASEFDLAREEFNAFCNNTTEGFRNSVLSGLMSRLNIWVNPRIVALTEKTDIDFDTLPEQLFTFYFAVPSRKDHLAPLAALMFNFLLSSALDKHYKKPLALFLDEFTNFGYIPGLPDALTIIRHKGIPAILGIQDHVQLKKVYGDDNATILFGQPGTKIFFRPRDLITARKISDILGPRTVVERKVLTNGQIVEREFPRALLAPDQLMSLAKGQAIAITPATPPINLATFHWRDYLDATTCPMPEFRTLEISETLKRTCAEAATKPHWQKEEDHPRKNEPKRHRHEKTETKPSEEHVAEEAPPPSAAEEEQAPKPNPPEEAGDEEVEVPDF